MQGDYIVEAVQHRADGEALDRRQQRHPQRVEADSSGNGQLFTVLMENPHSTHESASTVDLPRLEMAKAAVVATAALM
jgi:hypothetical protein